MKITDKPNQQSSILADVSSQSRNSMPELDQVYADVPCETCTDVPERGTKKPYIEPIIRTIAGGLFAILGVLLYFNNQYALIWLGTLIFIAFNLFQSGLSGLCFMEKFLKRFQFTSELDEIKTLSRELQAKSEQQAAYLDTLKLLNEAVIELSPGGYITSASEGWARIINQHTIDRPLIDFLTDQDRHLLEELPGKLKNQEDNNLRISFRLITSSGQKKWICANFMLTGQGENTMIKGVLSDISMVKQLEKERQSFQLELSHARRLSNLGEMAAGLAHELNQPLAAVSLYIHGCLKRLEDSPDDQQEIISAMRGAESQAKRAGDIIRQIRNFVRKAPLNREQTNINTLLTSAVHLLDVDPNVQDITFEYEFAEQLPLVQLDQMQIQQVLVNLIQNAVDAMQKIEGSNKILLRTRLHHDDIAVDVIDDGPGVPNDIVATIFDPFTTSRSNGLGLGLAICRSIIEQHGGVICHENVNSSGSCFSFTLPTTTTQENNDDADDSLHS